MSQRHCGVERNPTSLLPFEVYLFVQKDITNRSGRNIEGTTLNEKTPRKSEATRNSWQHKLHNYIFRSHLRDEIVISNKKLVGLTYLIRSPLVKNEKQPMQLARNFH
jgi:hypothetical protein